jgi:hypothetical protein
MLPPHSCLSEKMKDFYILHLASFTEKENSLTLLQLKSYNITLVLILSNRLTRILHRLQPIDQLAFEVGGSASGHHHR